MVDSPESDDAHQLPLDARVRAFSRRVESLFEDAAGSQVDERLATELSATLEELWVAADELQHRDAQLDEAAGQLVEQMRRYRELFDFAPDGYLVTDVAGQIREANLAAGEMLQRRPDRLVNATLIAHVRSSDRAALLRLLRHAAGDDAVHQAEIRLQRPDDGLLPVSVRVAASADDPPTLRLLLRDISQQRATEERAAQALVREREATARLREMDEVKNAFLLAVGHDLRGPLTAVVSLAEMLVDEHESEDVRARRIARSIRANSARVERVQRNLLDLDRLARGALALEPSEVDVQTLLERAVAVADTTDRPVIIRCEVGTARIDRGVAERILDNLLSNVATHTPADTPVEIYAEPWGRGVVLVVADHGHGVPQPLRQDLFRFNPASVPPRREGGRGLGLGLHLVGRFAGLHGGRAWVQETAGGGAEFHVALAERL